MVGQNTTNPGQDPYRFRTQFRRNCAVTGFGYPPLPSRALPGPYPRNVAPPPA